ncbi:ABC transporter substrate-binding protein [Microbacterium sp.]|uniref:ABC transporter substrate-binding protein n=1 Tax=Microbacterium sp. TaxID=51671 RepID=UPI003A862CCD
MSIRQLTAALALIPLAALTMSGCSSSSASSDAKDDPPANEELVALTVATVGFIADGSLITGIKQGFFEEEGLAVETSVVANPPAGLAAAQGGQVDIAYSPSIPLLNALSQGIPVQIVGPADGYPDAHVGDPSEVDGTGLVASASSGITSIADLAGKTIAVPARNAQLEVVIAYVLQEAGIDPSDGVNWVVLDFTSAAASLENGTIDAAGLVDPFLAQAIEAGGELLASPSVEFLGGGASGLWVSGTSTIEHKPDSIAAFHRAIVKSNEYATANPEVAIQAGLDYTASELTISDVKPPTWPTEVRIEVLQRSNEKMADLGFLPGEVDLSNAIYSG